MRRLYAMLNEHTKVIMSEEVHLKYTVLECFIYKLIINNLFTYNSKVSQSEPRYE